jgi:2-methylaconitate cis-trans-isomerase PrpF
MLLGHRWANPSTTTTLGHLQRSVRVCLDFLWTSEHGPADTTSATRPTTSGFLARNMTSVSLPRSVRASFWRGGTSKGVFFRLADLPEWLRSTLTTTGQMPDADFRRMQGFFAAVMGSPDPYGRQLNGMGGGISSLSKAMVVGPSTQPDVDVDYTFFQIGVEDGRLDMAGNCGNLSSAVGPFALNAGLHAPKPGGDGDGDGETTSITMRMRNTNTQKIIESTFQACRDNGLWRYHELGACSIDGVSGTASPITLSFWDPQGSKTGAALPTGNAVDEIVWGHDRKIKASLVDVSNPGIFIDGRDVGWDPSRSPEEMNADPDLLDLLETIRKRGTEMMGLDPNVGSIPKIVLVFPAATESDVDITCRALSMGQAHKAVPVTLALNLGVACKMPGTIPHQLSKHLHPSDTVIGHPSGTLQVGADMTETKISSAKLVRTARCHMDGYVNTLRADDEITAS